jgi:hypothetical protein
MIYDLKKGRKRYEDAGQIKGRILESLRQICLGLILRDLSVWVPKRMIPRLGALSVVDIRANKANCPWKKSGSRRPTLDQVEGRLHEEAMVIMRNKANWLAAALDRRDRSCQTKPISRRASGSGVRNKANFRRGPKGRGPGASRRGQMHKTKLMCDLRRGTGILPVNQDHGQDAHATAPSVAKQSQFWAGLPDGGKTGSHEGLETGNLGPEAPSGACDRWESR